MVRSAASRTRAKTRVISSPRNPSRRRRSPSSEAERRSIASVTPSSARLQSAISATSRPHCGARRRWRTATPRARWTARSIHPSRSDSRSAYADEIGGSSALPPDAWRRIDGRHGFAEAPGAWGVWGAISGLPISLDIEAGEEELAQLEVPLVGQRRPPMVEADVDPAADVHQARRRGHVEVELKHLAERGHALRVARIGHDVAAPGAAERGRRQLLARARHLARERGGAGVVPPPGPPPPRPRAPGAGEGGVGPAHTPPPGPPPQVRP